MLDWSHTSIKLLLTGGTKRGCNPILLLHVLQSQAPHEVHVSLWHETYHKQKLCFIAAAGKLPKRLLGLHRVRWGWGIVTHRPISHIHGYSKGDDYLSICVSWRLDNPTKVLHPSTFSCNFSRLCIISSLFIILSQCLLLRAYIR